MPLHKKIHAKDLLPTIILHFRVNNSNGLRHFEYELTGRLHYQKESKTFLIQRRGFDPRNYELLII